MLFLDNTRPRVSPKPHFGPAALPPLGVDPVYWSESGTRTGGMFWKDLWGGQFDAERVLGCFHMDGKPTRFPLGLAVRAV